MTSSFETLPYRPCVGIMVLNRDGLAFVGRRLGGPEHTDLTHEWQMPQGGIDDGEDAFRAAKRELYEETSIRSIEKIGEIGEWLAYDLPHDVIRHAWKGKYRGQKQKWFALRFTGKDSEIDIAHPGGGKHKPEFVEWKWADVMSLPDLIIPFKRKVYERVVKEFAPLAKS